MYTIHFRPSSHSEDGTVIATFKTAHDAVKALRRLKHFGARQVKNQVAIACLNAEYETLERANKILSKMQTVKIENFKEYHQIIIIEAVLPPKTSLKNAALVLDKKDVQLLMGLTRICGSPQTINMKKHTVLRFKYVGDDMLFSNFHQIPEEPYGRIWVEHNSLPLTKNFRVRGIF